MARIIGVMHDFDQIMALHAGVDLFHYSGCAVKQISPQAGDRLKTYAQQQLQRAVACLAWRGSRAHEGVHQARKSMRRARACLALGESALGAGAGMLDRELAKICDSLSGLRDAQARVESLNRLLISHAGEDICPVLEAGKRLAIIARADAMRNEQAIDSDFLTRRERLQVIAAAIPVLPWQQISLHGLANAMHISMHACDQAADKALRRGNVEDWHRLRRRRRRLAQQNTALEHSDVLLPSVMIPDRKLSSLLGEAQDLTVLRAFFKKHPGLSEENETRLRQFLKHEFRHISSEAMAAR